MCAVYFINIICILIIGLSSKWHDILAVGIPAVILITVALCTHLVVLGLFIGLWNRLLFTDFFFFSFTSSSSGSRGRSKGKGDNRSSTGVVEEKGGVRGYIDIDTAVIAR